MFGHLQVTQANAIDFIQNKSTQVHQLEDDGYWLAYDLESFTHFFEQFEVTEQKEDIEDDKHIHFQLGQALQSFSKLVEFSTKLPHLKHFDNFKFGANPFPLFVIFHSWKFHI